MAPRIKITTIKRMTNDATPAAYAGAYFLLTLLALLLAMTGCAPESITMSVDPATADAHPELVEQLEQACADWMAAGYAGDLKVVVSPVDYGPRWSVIDAEYVECLTSHDLACTDWFWWDAQKGTVVVTARAAGRLDVVSHELGHLLGAPHLSQPEALMADSPTVARPTPADVEATR